MLSRFMKRNVSKICLNILLLFSLRFGSFEGAFAKETAGNKVFLPLISSDTLKTEIQNNQFVWRLKHDENLQSASIETLSEFGHDWLDRALERCSSIEQIKDSSPDEVHNCAMLRYTAAGQFTPEDIAKIVANGDIILAVAEAQIIISSDDAGAKASQINTCKLPAHPTTCETLRVEISKPWYSGNVTHQAYAGAPGGPNYAYIKLRAVSQTKDKKIRYNNNDKKYSNTSWAGPENYYVGWNAGGYAITEAWIKSYDYGEIHMGSAKLDL